MQLVKTFTSEEKEKCKAAEGLLTTLSKHFEPHHIRVALSVQYKKLKRKSNESIQEGMGKLWTKAVECDYEEYDTELMDQFIRQLEDKGIISKILNELSQMEFTNDVTT